MFNHIKKAAHRLAEADMVFWLMPLLIILLIAGTLTQRWLGLYEAHQTYFASFIIWAGPIPLPGGYIILGLLTINLTAKFLLKSEWSFKKSGIILSHLGALILLIGGLITSITAVERYMIIPEGGETPFTYHYIDKALMIFEDDNEIARLHFGKISNWKNANLPFDIKILSSCENCEIIKREESKTYDTNTPYQNMAQFMSLKPKPSDIDPEANISGLEFQIKGTSADGHYIAFKGMPKPIEFNIEKKTYTLIFGNEQYTLPFSIQLKDFVKDDYDGISMARGYHSDIIINDGSVKWETRIEMNKPLRYKGYTFFQSSFDQTDREEITILSVVKNQGRLFPYIGTSILALGLLLHIAIIFRRKSA